MFAALHHPDLAVVAALRSYPEAQRRPCGVLEELPGISLEKVKLPLRAVNACARDTGIDAGWPLNMALVRCPDLVVLPSDHPAEKSILAEMVTLGESLTPDLEVTNRDTLILDLSRATSRQVSRLGFLETEDGGLCHVRATTPDLARLAVRHPASRGSFISSENLCGMSLDLLGCLPGGRQFLPLLTDWGLRDLGGFMALPRQGLIERLGPDAGRWHDLLHGKVCRMLRLHRPPESLVQEFEFEDVVTSIEPLAFAFKRLLHTLSARLAARAVAVKELRLTLLLEHGKPLQRVLRLPEPRVSETELLRPVMILLDSIKLSAPARGVVLDVETASPSAAQCDWFARQLPQPARWIDTLAQLEGLLGPDRVGIPIRGTSYRPDDFTLWPADGTALPQNEYPAEARETSLPTVPLRRFRPPQEIIVAVEPGSPRPLALLSGRFRGSITQRRGPFLSSGDWWNPATGWQSAEWDIQLGDHILRIAFVPPDRWQLHGTYT